MAAEAESKGSPGSRARRPGSKAERKRTARRRPKQTGFTFRTWGGKRRGAGRKPKGDRAGVPHRPRPALASRFPVHVSLRVRQGLPSLRSRKAYKAVEQALLFGCQRDGFRLVHFCILKNHIHLIVEAKDGRVLARRIQGLSISLARRLNHRLRRRGAVFADRYHARILRTPRETRDCLLYVLNNRRSHTRRRGERDRLPPGGADHYSSGPWFDGWRTPPRNRPDDGQAPPLTVTARTWLLSNGWRIHGLLGLDELPGR
jgi:REP element-mobilizing transposase RayT